ncbi:MAG: helix-hairpin-helix domain-containing protein [Chloroflexota bacterium]
MLKRAVPFLGGLFTGLLAAGALYLLIAEPRGQPVVLHPPATPEPIRVHVSGAVNQPGVVTLPQGSIVQQAIEAAGGALPEADLDHLNLAAIVQTGQRIHVPLRGETTAPSDQAAEPGSSARLNLNTATAPELELLPGIGPVLASNIIAYREAHGPFQSVEQLLDVPGIGPAKLSQIRDLVTVE